MSKPSKKKKGRWTKNDTELTVMALPTTIWYILFCFLPMFGLIMRSRITKSPAERVSFITCSTVTGPAYKKLFVPDQIQRPVRHPEKHNPV